MDKLIDKRFERLEKALSSLIDSVTKYHPTAAHAKELEAADHELSKELEQIEAHQNNFIRILELRKSSAALDTQIRETLSSLASTRKDIVTTQTTTFAAGPHYPIAYEELLSYARRISKTTLPPAGAFGTVDPAQPDPGTQTPLPEASQSQQLQAASAAPTPSQSQSPITTTAAAPNGLIVEQSSQATSGGKTTLPEGMSQYLNPLSGQPFFPWPLEDKIRGGALASNQILLEKGINPEGFDPVEEEERKVREEEERKEREEKEKAEREEREKKMREDRERQRREREQQRLKEAELMRQASSAAAPSMSPVGGEKKQFQFAALDDLDDDDD